MKIGSVNCAAFEDRGALRLLALLVAASVTAGCLEPCVSRCDGANLQTCSIAGNDFGRTLLRKSTPCSGACVQNMATGDAFCAQSATPIPECQQDGDICYHGAAANCRASYLETSKACSGACVLSAGKAFCAESSGPVPECQQDGRVCYQGAIGTCRAGYLESSTACATGSTCAAVGGSYGPICVLSTTPDPSCPPPSGPFQESSYCSGNTQVSCQWGYTVERANCVTNFCTEVGSDARCALSPTRDPRCGNPLAESSAFCDANTVWSCWNGYPVDRQACGATGTCFVNTDGDGYCEGGSPVFAGNSASP